MCLAIYSAIIKDRVLKVKYDMVTKINFSLEFTTPSGHTTSTVPSGVEILLYHSVDDFY